MRSTRSKRRLMIGAAAAAAVAVVPAVAVAAGTTKPDNTEAARQAIVGGKARNVILLIGDGMGDSEITIARNYAKGAAGRLSLDSLPLTGAYTTYAVQKANPSLPDYVTDSAASGSGWATGKKTYNGAISVTPDGKAQATILELAKKAGFRTGDVSTAEIQDATPAVLVSHVTDRSCYGPVAVSTTCPTNAKENGGAGSISEQLVQTRADIVLGGGSKSFDEVVKAGPFAGRTVLDQAKAAGYQVVTDATDISRARRSVRTCCTAVPSDTTTDSVISRTRLCPGSPCRRSSPVTSSTRAGTSCAEARFTATVRGMPSARQEASCRHASASTQLPSAVMWPLRSARLMKRSGGSSPRRGCCQRTRASTAAGPPSDSRTVGW